MPKKPKLSTPEWIKKGYDSEEEYNKKRQKEEPLAGSSKSQTKRINKKKKSEGKTFKIRECPECGSDDVNVMLTGEEGRGTGEWECKKCKWQGADIVEKELNEDELMKYLDEKGEEVI